ncbi:MAG: cation diffusion facilitator family transporter [Paludibacteraceae bacterium]|nr:cation diffusion facilitator family transporter [Paludibacteraceae bacterium]
MGHHHHHHHVESIGTVFIIGIVLNALYILLEAGVGFYTDSLGLLSDAGHNLSDVFSLLLAFAGVKLASVAVSKHFTYGYRRSTILISLLNAVILLVAVGAIVIEAIHDLSHPSAINGAAVSVTATVGILVNGLTAFLLMRGQKNDLNIRGAFLHMLADTLVSVGVVVAGLVIYFTDFYLIDPIVSLVVAVVILVAALRLLSDSLRLSLDGIPEGIDFDRVQALMTDVPHVLSVHHLHVWALSTTLNALTAHVVIDSHDHSEQVLSALKHRLADYGIAHTTLQLELRDSACHESEVLQA